MINRIVITGRLTRDPEMKTTNNGTSVATFTVACDRNFKAANGERETDFIPVVAWRQLAEICEKILHKGNMVAIAGRLQIRNYEDKEGNRRTIAEIVADDVQNMTPKSQNEAAAAQPAAKEPAEEREPLDDLPF